MTRIRLLSRQGRRTEALDLCDSLAAVAAQAGDSLLRKMTLLTKAELLCQNQNPDDALPLLEGITTDIVRYPDLYAQYERTLACSLAASGDTRPARAHFERATRICETTRNVPATLELARGWRLAEAQAAARGPVAGPPAHPRDPDDAVVHARTVLQGASALMVHIGRPELLAREIVHLLAETGCVIAARAVAKADDGRIETLAIAGRPLSDGWHAARCFPVGTARDRAIEVHVEPEPDVESIATLNAVALLLGIVHDLERARAEREERLTLWPIDDVPIDGGQAVVSGQMREVMGQARRVASTSVSVLITGESGTGKEILARAIHNFSSRAQKPFIPFNCTAVPREMLESQLFGHRRGSFTGADRDNPGLIRAAREGTLFLDEIGELGLDLQPKLLRFLESGEICPLGEPTPFTVDVRIVAATNSNLEELVRDGRFREDLFYRLNVIRLKIPPLRERRDEIPGLAHYFVGRAAEEFSKGQVRLAEETMEQLLLYAWPGNVRQLNNELRRMVALADRDAVLSPDQLSHEILSATPAPERRINGSDIAVPLHGKLLPAISRVEREMIRVALTEHHGVDAAARALGISRKGLYLKRQRLGL